MRVAVTAAISMVAWLRADVPNAHAEPHLMIRSDAGCPSAEAVTAALLAIRPDSEWPPLVAAVHLADGHLLVELGQDADNRREIAAVGDCAERASGVALVVAVWSGSLPERSAGPPQLTAITPARAVVAAKPAMISEVGVSAFSPLVGGFAPGAQLELASFRPDAWLGARAVAAYQSARSVRVDIGETRYERVELGALLATRWVGRRMFLGGDVGLLGAFTSAHGVGYSQNQSARGANGAAAADGRVGFRVGRFRLWCELQGRRWASKETLRVEPLTTGSSSTSALPAWDARLGFGASLVFGP